MLARNATYAGDASFYEVSMRRLSEATPGAVRDAARRWHTAGSLTIEVHPFVEATAAETGADRSNGPPMPDSFPTVNFDDFERGFLSNGMELIVANRSAVPVVQFRMLLDAGFAADAFAKLGTSSLTMSMLDEGTKKRNSLEISDELSKLGTNLSSGANLDQSAVSLNTLKENLDPSLDIFADVIMNPAFPESELSRIKKQTAAGIQREQASPFGLAQRLMPGLVYGEGHAYNMPLTGSGTEESSGRVSRATIVVDFHATWFRPNNATMIVVGDTTLERIAAETREAVREMEGTGCAAEKRRRRGTQRHRACLHSGPSGCRAIADYRRVNRPHRQITRTRLRFRP